MHYGSQKKWEIKGKEFCRNNGKKRDLNVHIQKDTQFQGEKFRFTSRNIIKLLRVKYKRKTWKQQWRSDLSHTSQFFTKKALRSLKYRYWKRWKKNVQRILYLTKSHQNKGETKILSGKSWGNLLPPDPISYKKCWRSPSSWMKGHYTVTWSHGGNYMGNIKASFLGFLVCNSTFIFYMI